MVDSSNKAALAAIRKELFILIVAEAIERVPVEFFLVSDNGSAMVASVSFYVVYFVSCVLVLLMLLLFCVIQHYCYAAAGYAIGSKFILKLKLQKGILKSNLEGKCILKPNLEGKCI